MGIRLLMACFVAIFVGCSAAGNWLSGSATNSDPAMFPIQLEGVQIGVTTKDDVQHLLGSPTDIQLSSDQHQASEAWSYAQANPSIHPLQYVPGFGKFAISKRQRQVSFAISFTSDGVVDGIGLRGVQPYGRQQVSATTSGKPSTIHFYGWNNPLTHHARQDASLGSGISRE
jgi:hypothetical protein